LWRQQRVLTDVVEIELGDVGDEVRRESRRRLRQRQIRGIEVGFLACRQFVAEQRIVVRRASLFAPRARGGAHPAGR
jgi:hypothetical protein